MFSNPKHFFFSSYFIAFILTIIVLGFLPDLFDKYKIEIAEKGDIESLDNFRIYCSDLNSDGNSEKIYSFDHSGKHSLLVYTYDGGMVDQWNMDGLIPGRGERLACGDYDKDGFNEIYTFLERNDTVFLYCVEPMDTINPMRINNRFICTLTHQYANPEYLILNPQFKDINADGNGDLFFVINSGKSKFPRNIFIYDIAKDSITISKNYGSTLQQKDVWLFDMDNDGYLEVFGGNSAAGQVPDSLGYNYNDYSAWLLAFDHQLELLYKPIEFPGFRSVLDVVPVSINGTTLFACFYNHTGQLNNYPKLFLVNTKGNIVKEHLFPKSSKIHRWLIVSESNDASFFNIIDQNGNVSIYNEDLVFVNELDLGYSIDKSLSQFDLDLDSIKEFVFITGNNEITITQNDFSDPTSFITEFHPTNIKLLKNNTKDRPSLFIYEDSRYLNLQYRRNPLAPLRFLIYFLIYLGILLFYETIKKIQITQIQRKERLRNQIVNLQLKSFRNQMDPHFTFNVFNTMAHKIQKESPESYSAFMEFSNLIRKTLVSSDSITRTIEDELSQLKSYLELEKLRFGDKVSYAIDVEADIDQNTHIPKMIIQTYVENAIKHGIRHKKETGTVTIKISIQSKNILFEITDDGIGREKAKEFSKDSTGFGLKIMDNYFKLFNEYNESKIVHEINDMYDEQNNPTGTKVIILIPLNFSYKLKKHGKR